jgi:hypothetical protein
VLGPMATSWALFLFPTSSSSSNETLTLLSPLQPSQPGYRTRPLVQKGNLPRLLATWGTCRSLFLIRGCWNGASKPFGRAIAPSGNACSKHAALLRTDKKPPKLAKATPVGSVARPTTSVTLRILTCACVWNTLTLYDHVCSSCNHQPLHFKSVVHSACVRVCPLPVVLDSFIPSP